MNEYGAVGKTYKLSNRRIIHLEVDGNLFGSAMFSASDMSDQQAQEIFETKYDEVRRSCKDNFSFGEMISLLSANKMVFVFPESLPDWMNPFKAKMLRVDF